MKASNVVKLEVESRSVNESFARVVVSAFAAQLDPTIEEVNDIKTAVSEAVTNCIVHAYENKVGKIYITVSLYDEGLVKIKIRDKGRGIEDVKKGNGAALYHCRRRAGRPWLCRDGELYG